MPITAHPTGVIPAPDTAREALAEMVQGEGSLLDALERALRRLTGVTVPRTEWGPVPDHLRMNFSPLTGSVIQPLLVAA